MTADYRERFRQLVKELENNRQLELDVAQIERGHMQKAIQKIEKKACVRLPEALHQFYGQVGEVHVQWTLKFDARVKHIGCEVINAVTGSIHILDLETMLLGPAEEGWKNYLWFDFMDDAQIEEIEPLRPLDYFYPDRKACAGLIVAEGVLSKHVYLHTIELDLEPLNLTVEKYLSLLFQTRGFMFWQEAFVIPGGIEAVKLRHYAPQLFPKVNLSPFKPK